LSIMLGQAWPCAPPPKSQNSQGFTITITHILCRGHFKANASMRG
jgi:hypothetical protein